MLVGLLTVIIGFTNSQILLKYAVATFLSHIPVTANYFFWQKNLGMVIIAPT